MAVKKAGKAETKVEAKATTQPQPLSGRHFYKIGEVCEMTDTQPYVLRFWESEFPQLGPMKNRSGQRLYQQKDIDLVIRIKKLLYDEEYTIAGARKKLEEEGVVAPIETPPSGLQRRSAGSARTAPSTAADRHLAETLRKLRAELRDLKTTLTKR